MCLCIGVYVYSVWDLKSLYWEGNALPRRKYIWGDLAQFKKNIGVTQGASQCPVDGRKLTAPVARESSWGQLKLSRVLATGCSHTPSEHPSDTGWSHGCPTQELILSTVQVLLIEAPWVSLVFCLFVFAHTIHFVGYSPIRNRTHAPALRAQSLNHWTDKEVLSESLFSAANLCDSSHDFFICFLPKCDAQSRARSQPWRSQHLASSQHDLHQDFSHLIN